MRSEKRSHDSVLYHEWIPTKTLLRVFLIGFPLSSVVFVVISAHILNCPGLLLGLAPLLFTILLIVNYRGIDIRITPKEIKVCFGIINRKRIPIKDILACAPTQPDIRRYRSYFGIQSGYDGSRAYLASDGLAVQIIPVRGRAFVFSSKYPRTICDIIEEQT